MNKKDLSRKPQIVVIGGGTGLPVILNNLKQQDVEITAIVNVADDGGSSGRLSKGINAVPPGDIRNVLTSLSNLSKEELKLFQYRFKNNDSFLSGHSLGNLVIAALSEMKGDINTAVEFLSSMMKITGKVYPATNERLQLCAEFQDGTQMSGEYEITYADKKIKRVWVECFDKKSIPEADEQVIQAILNADEIVLGPGSLFTSILPNLMINNLGKAVIKSKAKIIYICNIMTQLGETDGFTDADHVAVLNRHMHCNFIDTVIVNTEPVPVEKIDYQKFNEICKPVKHDQLSLEKMGCNTIVGNFLQINNNGVFHNGRLVAEQLVDLLTRK